MRQLATRPWMTAGVALVAAGAITVAPVTVPLPEHHLVDIQLVAGEVDITIDFVRHGQSVDNVEGILGTLPAGAALTDLGKEQAITVGQALYNGGGNDIDGIAAVYASEFLRTQQTAWPLVQLLQGSGDGTDLPDGPTPLLDPSQILYGLNEINAGFLEGAQLTTPVELAYVLPTLMWILGLYFFPMLGSDANPNGMAFEDRVNDAVQAIYDNTVGGDSDKLTNVAFAHAGTIFAWTLMNVKNPDFGLALKGLIDTHEPLPNTGQVVIEGNPQDGWTLVSWNGTEVPETPDFLTSLFVGFRNLITAPQMALWNLCESIFGSGSTDVGDPAPAGFDDVIGGITSALNDGAAGVGAAGEASLSLTDLLAI